MCARFLPLEHRGTADPACPEPVEGRARSRHAWTSGCVRLVPPADRVTVAPAPDYDAYSKDVPERGVPEVLSQYRECFYNRTRLHSSLGFVSPERFEAGRSSQSPRVHRPWARSGFRRSSCALCRGSSPRRTQRARGGGLSAFVLFVLFVVHSDRHLVSEPSLFPFA